MLVGGGGHQFSYVPPDRAGIYVEGQVRDAIQIAVGGEKIIFVARNNDSVLAFRR